MDKRKFVFHVEDAVEKTTHGESAIFRILLDEKSCGAKNFSLLVNTMKAGLNCNATGLGHKHDVEHCLFGLSGTGGISIGGEIYKVEPMPIRLAQVRLLLQNFHVFVRVHKNRCRTTNPLGRQSSIHCQNPPLARIAG